MNAQVTAAIARAMARHRAGQIDRRQLLRLLGGLGISAASLTALPAIAGATPRRIGMSLQDVGTPEAPIQDIGTPSAPATPQLGEQPDGTYVWRVQAGGMSEDPEAMLEAMAFLPGEITINAGDSIFFDFRGFHTVTFMSGEELPPFLMPDEGAATPTAGGPPRLIFNPQLIFPSEETTYDGTGFVNSGVPLDPTTPPFTLTFTAPGTYEYTCAVHPKVMKATVIVQEQGADLPHDQAAYDQMASEQLAQILEQAQAVADEFSQATPAAGTDGGQTWEVAAGAGEEQAEALRFLPDRLEIKAGDTVHWTNRSVSEPHTVTFTSGEAPPELILIETKEGGPPTLVLNPEIVPPAGGPIYSGSGYVNSGVLDEAAGLPTTFELSFDTPGEYEYFCAFHGGAGPDGAFEGMVGRIVVS